MCSRWSMSHKWTSAANPTEVCYIRYVLTKNSKWRNGKYWDVDWKGTESFKSTDKVLKIENNTYSELFFLSSLNHIFLTFCFVCLHCACRVLSTFKNIFEIWILDSKLAAVLRKKFFYNSLMFWCQVLVKNIRFAIEL